jgi:hypothetical protein
LNSYFGIFNLRSYYTKGLSTKQVLIPDLQSGTYIGDTDIDVSTTIPLTFRTSSSDYSLKSNLRAAFRANHSLNYNIIDNIRLNPNNEHKLSTVVSNITQNQFYLYRNNGYRTHNIDTSYTGLSSTDIIYPTISTEIIKHFIIGLKPDHANDRIIIHAESNPGLEPQINGKDVKLCALSLYSYKSPLLISENEALQSYCLKDEETPSTYYGLIGTAQYWDDY